MRRYCSPRRRLRRSAASSVELALLLPIFILFLLFAVDFARLYYHYTIVTNCARNGALYGSDPVAARNRPMRPCRPPPRPTPPTSIPSPP